MKAFPILLQAQVDNILADHVSDPADMAKLASYLSGEVTGPTALIDGGINFS